MTSNKEELVSICKGLGQCFTQSSGGSGDGDDDDDDDGVL